MENIHRAWEKRLVDKWGLIFRPVADASCRSADVRARIARCEEVEHLSPALPVSDDKEVVLALAVGEPRGDPLEELVGVKDSLAASQLQPFGGLRPCAGGQHQVSRQMMLHAIALEREGGHVEGDDLSVSPGDRLHP